MIIVAGVEDGELRGLSCFLNTVSNSSLRKVMISALFAQKCHNLPSVRANTRLRLKASLSQYVRIVNVEAASYLLIEELVKLHVKPIVQDFFHA